MSENAWDFIMGLAQGMTLVAVAQVSFYLTLEIMWRWNRVRK